MNKNPGLGIALTGKFYWTFIEKFIPTSLKILPKKTKRKEHPKSFHEASTFLISKPNKEPTRKENYRLMFLINIDVTSQKVLEKSTLKGSYTMITWDLALEYKGVSTHTSINVIYHINRMKDKNYMIISINTSSDVFLQQLTNSILLWLKTLNKLAIEEIHII